MSKFSEHPLSGKHNIDTAFSSGWDFYKKWFIPMYAISFILALIVAALTSTMDISGLQYTSDLTDITSQLKSMMGIYAVVALISLAFNTLLQYFIIYKPIDPDFSFMDAIGKVITRYYLPLLIVFILLGVFAIIAMTLGALLLFVGIFFAIPYVMLFIALATPVIMIENGGIDGTIRRLIKLVHKKFWPNMGWISVYLVLVIFFSFIVGTLVMLPFSGSMIKSLMDPEAASKVLEIASNPAYIILSSLASGLTAPLLPILGLIIYFNNSDSDNGEERMPSDNDNNGKVKVEDLYSSNDNDNFSPTVDDLTP